MLESTDSSLDSLVFASGSFTFGGKEVVLFLLRPAVKMSGSLLERRGLGCGVGTGMLSKSVWEAR